MPFDSLAVDAFDPRVAFIPQPREFVIRLCNRDASLVAVVDEVDYEWARQSIWGCCMSRARENAFVEKFYAKRSWHTPKGRETVYLHKEILLRAKGPPPHRAYTIGDHKNGDSLDCRRDNLRWATPRMNRLNINGRYPADLLDEVA